MGGGGGGSSKNKQNLTHGNSWKGPMTKSWICTWALYFINIWLVKIIFGKNRMMIKLFYVHSYVDTNVSLTDHDSCNVKTLMN